MFSKETNDQQKIAILNNLFLGEVGGDSHHIRQALSIELSLKEQEAEMFIEEQKDVPEEGETFLKECELPLLLSIVNSDGSGKLTEYLTSDMFLDIWRPEEFQTALSRVMENEGLIKTHLLTLLSSVCGRMWFCWLDPNQ